ncbi:MAG: HU family DNA-binding protein [Acidobacteria bacterium]|nr:HU family DNA-binding protein [Acidobacteriota bacterium]
MSLKKRDIARAIHEAEPRISLTEAVALVDVLMDQVKDGFVADGKVMVTNFGTFEVVERAARQGVNPATREPMMIPAHKALTFQPAPALLRAIND